MLLHLAEGPEVAPDVMKDAIEDNPNLALMTGGDQIGERLVSAKPPINAKIVGGIIAMGA
jgi:hypothetical protein